MFTQMFQQIKAHAIFFSPSHLNRLFKAALVQAQPSIKLMLWSPASNQIVEENAVCSNRNCHHWQIMSFYICVYLSFVCLNCVHLSCTLIIGLNCVCLDLLNIPIHTLKNLINQDYLSKKVLTTLRGPLSTYSATNKQQLELKKVIYLFLFCFLGKSRRASLIF